MLDQKIEKIISQVSAITAENLHFRTLSDSRISACERQSQKNIHSAVDSVVKVIESTRRDLLILEAKVSQDYQTAQKRSGAFDVLEASFAPIAASVASMQASITSISEAQAVLSGQSSSASLSIQEMKLESQHALSTARALEEKVTSRFQPQFLEMGDRMDSIDAQLASLSSGGQQRLEKRLAVIRDEISGHTSQSNRIFDRIQNEILEMQDKLSKLSMEIVGSAQRADLSHQSLKETLLPSISSLQALVNSLSFRLNRSLQTVQDNMKMVKDGSDMGRSDLACEIAVFSCLEAVVARVEYDSLSSNVSLLRQHQVQAATAASTSVAAVADKLQELEINVKAMDSDQISAADLFSKRLVSVEDIIAATSNQQELVNTQSSQIISHIESIEARVESQSKAIGVVEGTVERTERVTESLSKEVERLSVASSAAETLIESQSKAIGVVEGTVERTERVTESLSKEVERLSVESNVTVTSACFALKEELLQEIRSKISAFEQDVQVQADALQELLDTVSKQQTITNDFIAEVRAPKND